MTNVTTLHPPQTSLRDLNLALVGNGRIAALIVSATSAAR